MPGVYKKNWKYFYETTYYNFNKNRNIDIVFYNKSEENPVFIHPITGVRKIVKNERKYLGNIEINNLKSGMAKRTKYNIWKIFKKGV